MTVRVKVPHEFREEQVDVKKALKKKFPCDRKHLLSRIPIAHWLPNYPLSNLYYDIIAGLTVALTAIPQGIAYAVIAGLPPQYGLYAEIMPGLVYMIFGSCSYITIGELNGRDTIWIGSRDGFIRIAGSTVYLFGILIIHIVMCPHRSHSHNGVNDTAVCEVKSGLRRPLCIP